MNYRLIFLLSLFGLAMAIATVYWIPSNVELFFWIAIFLVCAYLIAKNAPGKYFTHGLLTSLVNCIWITSAHILLYSTYIATHQQEAAMMTKWPHAMAIHPRIVMLITGPIIGFLSGLVLGLFAFVASKLVKKNVSVA